MVIKDIFRKYPNRYEGIISTLCDNLDSLDEPEARASMIWIIGEYAERIDNAGELLGTFLENFADETTAVQLQLLTAIVKLFLKRPAETQELVQSVLSLATQDSDNPDLRDRGYIYWRLLSTDPAAAKEVVLAEKPLISEETDRLEPNLLNELIGNLSTLASVYHKPASSFVEGKAPVRHISLPVKAQPSTTEYTEEEAPVGLTPADDGPASVPQPSGEGDLLGDLLNLDLPPAPTGGGYNVPMMGGGADMDLLSGDLTGLYLGGPSGTGMISGQMQGAIQTGGTGGVGALAELLGTSVAGGSYVAPKQMWLEAAQGKGMEIRGSWARRQGQIFMDMTFTNKALSPMGEFAIQFNKNSFGLSPAAPLQVWSPLHPNQGNDTSLLVNHGVQVARMDPLTMLQVAIKNNVGVFYFSSLVPVNVLLIEDGRMDRKVFLATWKEIASTNEVQSTVNTPSLTADQVQSKLEPNNIFLVAKRAVEVGETKQDLLYMSLKFTNNVWVLAELKVTTPFTNIQLALKTHVLEVIPAVQEAMGTILNQA